MYQTVDPVVDKSRSPELQRDELSTLILNGLFSGQIKARPNLEPVSITLKAKDEAKNFRNAYARVRYILAIPNRYVAW